ncbi:MAG TPA: monofunctional biosynthetic peptidoglycan transglycosylase [bacterium]|nr:monofunctional biosynthetic peptidoglycan transglycosylase [bacterium]
MGKSKSRNPWLRGIGYTLALIVAIEGVVLLCGLLENSWLRNHNPSSTAFTRRESMLSRRPADFSWRNLGDISDSLKRAVLVSEDDAFFVHEGVDFSELKKSWDINLKKERIARGGSTISMQLVKNLYFSQARNPLRKLNEILLTLDLEHKLPKERILEIYLNVVEWGDGIYGAENASQYYFRKGADRLSSSEAAYLAAILPNPVYLSRHNTRRAKGRQAIILRRMGKRSLPEEVR